MSERIVYCRASAKSVDEGSEDIDQGGGCGVRELRDGEEGDGEQSIRHHASAIQIY